MECFFPPILTLYPARTPIARTRIYDKKQKKKHTRNKSSTTHGGHKARPLPYPKASPAPLLLLNNQPSITRTQLLDKLLRDLESAISHGVRVDPSTFSSLLESCYRSGHLSHGLRLHRLIPRSLLRNSADLSSKLLRLYSSLGLLDHAHRLFDEMRPHTRTRSAFPWNSLISGYADAGQFEDAIALYNQMDEDGVPPDPFTFPRVLKACAGLRYISLGEAVHRHALRAGLARHPFVLNALVDMYAKCGDIHKALRAFRMIPQRDNVSWNSMLAAYAHHALHPQAVALFREMLLTGPHPDPFAISTLLSGAKAFDSPRLGREIHGWVLRHGLEDHVPVANALVSMYAEYNLLSCARAVFESMEEKDVVSWNAIVSAYRRETEALALFERMVQSGGVMPDRITFVSLLSACANLGLVEEGRELFAEMEGEKYGIKAGMEHCSCMVNLLGRAGFVDEAYEFILQRDAGGPTVWGALLYACLVHGNVRVGEMAAGRLFELEPDNALNFELMMDIYKKAGREDDVDEVKRMMEARGLDS